jgi:hypothetical protein
MCRKPNGSGIFSQKENGVRNSFSYLLLLFSGGETLKKLPGSRKNKGVGSLFSPPAITDDLEASLAQAR